MTGADGDTSGSIQVLYVNDDTDFAELARTKLLNSFANFEVTAVATADAALTRVEGSAIDCVVTSYSLPDGTGIDLLERLGSERGKLPTILFTDQGSEQVASDATRAGVSDYIPIRSDQNSFELLAHRIQTLVDAARQREIADQVSKRFQRTLERTTDAIYAVDKEWRIEYMNERMADRVDRDPDTVVGTTLWEAFPSIVGTGLEERYRTAMKTGEAVSFEKRLGEPFEYWVEVRAFPDDDGLTVFSREITAERERELERERGEAILQNIHDIVFVLDEERSIEFANTAAKRLIAGDRSTDLTGQQLGAVVGDRISDSETARLSNVIATTLDGREGDGGSTGLYDADLQLDISAESDERTFDVRVTPFRSGGVAQVLVVARDVTEQSEVKRQLERDRDALTELQAVMAESDVPVQTRLEDLLEVGCRTLGLDIGIVSHIQDSDYNVEAVHAPTAEIEAGDRFDLDSTYCEEVVEKGEICSFTDAVGDGKATNPAYREFERESYIGVPLVVDDERYGTVNFSAKATRRRFTDGERTFLQVLAQWVGKELSRQRSRDRAAAKEQRLRQIIDMLPQLVFAKDSTGEFLLANEAIADAYGTTVEELEGATDADFARSAAEARQFREDDRAVIESGERKDIPEEPLTTADGEELVMQTTKIPYDPVDHESDAVLGVATDITGLKQRDDQIELQSEAMEVAMDGIAILDGDEYVYMNQKHADIFGYEPAELVGSEWRRLYEDGEIERFESEVFPALAEDGEWRGEAIGQKADGTPVHQDLGLSLLDSGELICTNRDITEQKEREQERARQRTRLRALFNKSPNGIIVHDGDGRVIDANETEIESLGMDRETLLSMNVAEFEVGIGRPELQELWADMSVGDVLKVEGEHRRQNGEEFPVEVWVNKAEVDGNERYIAVSRDITDRKEREQELREVKERLDLAVEGADIGIWDWNMQTDAVTFNEQWAAMLGFSLDEIAPTLQTWEDRVHPADMPHVESELEAHLAGETALYDCEHRVQTKDGEWKWIRDVGKVVEREDGEPTRAVGIHLDITEQKRSALFLEEERDMFAQGPAVVFKWQNEDGWPVEYVSENVTETFGYTPEQLQSGDVPYTELIHDDDIGRIEQEVERNSDQTTDRFSHDPYRMVTSSGEVRWVTDNTKILRNDGEITHYLGYLIDITEQKRLEQSLRESEQSLRELTAVASDTGQSFEEKLTTLLELGRERLNVPYAFLNRLDDETQHVVKAVGDHPELQTGADAPLSETYCRKTVQQDGVFDVHDAVEDGWEADPGYERFELGCYIGETVVVDGDRYGTLCFADQASRDHRFDDNERAFVELLVQWISYELAGDAFETKLQEMNNTARRLMTAPSQERIAAITIESAKSVLDMPINGIWWHDDATGTLVPGGMTEEAAAVLPEQPTLESGESAAYDVFEAGQARTYDDLDDVGGLHNEDTILASEAILPLGEFGVVTAGSTEPRAFSETDLNLLQVLSATVEAALNRAQREETLRETQEQLKQSNEELEQFAYAASHDLQEPLRTVSSYLTLLERRYGDELDDDATDFIDFAVDGADRMREMIQALLAYSRVDTRGQSFEPVSVATLFERIEQGLRVTIDEADATLSGPSAEFVVSGDRSQLSQLFQNLVENAIKYNDGTPHVDVSAARHGEMVQFEVTDDGIGMDPKQTDDIFEVFQRLHTHEEFAGTGIGLSICRKIVDRHEGEIAVESTPGEGSTFIVTLPRGEPSDE